MSVPYYIGAKAIVERLGYKSPRMVYKLVRKYGLPVHKRIRQNRTGACQALAISESLVTAWEASRGIEYVKAYQAKCDARDEARRNGFVPEGTNGARRSAPK